MFTKAANFYSRPTNWIIIHCLSNYKHVSITYTLYYYSVRQSQGDTIHLSIFSPNTDQFLPHDATQSVVMGQYIVCPSVHP